MGDPYKDAISFANTSTTSLFLTFLKTKLLGEKVPIESWPTNGKFVSADLLYIRPYVLQYIMESTESTYMFVATQLYAYIIKAQVKEFVSYVSTLDGASKAKAEASLHTLRNFIDQLKTVELGTK